MNRASKIARTVALLVAAAWFVLIAVVFARRAVYPYDLEWMEGGTLCHALRLLEGKPIYAPPSVEFIPFLYTPLYPALLALLSKATGLGYTMARVVSLLGFGLALVLGGRFAVRHGGSRAAAVVAMALPVAAYVKTGTFYDLARADSLWLGLVTAGLLALHHASRNTDGTRRTDPRRHLTAAGAALLLVAAFFTKQTASPLMLAGGAALLLLDWRLVPAFAGTAAFAGIPLLWWLNRSSDGWFWTYVFKLHQSHEFYYRRAFVQTPVELLKIIGPALLIVPWALARRRSVALLYASWLALVGLAVACLAFGTQWAYSNAYLPGVFFPAVAIGVAAGRLVTHEPVRALPRLRPAFVFLLAAASLVLLRFDPRRACDHLGACRPLVPSAADREAGARLVERLRAVDGEVLVPFHPFYAHLAGKRTFVHRMGVMDVAASGLRPAGLVEGIAARRWKLAVFDYKIDGTWHFWPGFLDAYQEAPPSVGPPMVSGADTHPRYAFVPRSSPGQ